MIKFLITKCWFLVFEALLAVETRGIDALDYYGGPWLLMLDEERLLVLPTILMIYYCYYYCYCLFWLIYLVLFYELGPELLFCFLWWCCAEVLLFETALGCYYWINISALLFNTLNLVSFKFVSVLFERSTWSPTSFVYNEGRSGRIFSKDFLKLLIYPYTRLVLFIFCYICLEGYSTRWWLLAFYWCFCCTTYWFWA